METEILNFSKNTLIMNRIKAIISSTLLAFMLLGIATHANAESYLYQGETMYKGDTLFSPNHEYRLVFQNDGNLVVYNSQDKALWHSGTHGMSNAATLRMQDDGNLVLYSDSLTPLWHTKTHLGPYAEYELVMQNDGNLVLYTHTLHFFGTTVTPIWDSQGHVK